MSIGPLFDAGLAAGRKESAAKIERLLAVLKPFVVAAADAEGYPANHPIGCDPAMMLEGLTVADLRRAAIACQQQAREKSDG